VGINEGLKHDSGIHCNELVSLPKQMLTDWVGNLHPGFNLIWNSGLLVMSYCQVFDVETARNVVK
jgi:hypothetical protein